MIAYLHLLLLFEVLVSLLIWWRVYFFLETQTVTCLLCLRLLVFYFGYFLN